MVHTELNNSPKMMFSSILDLKDPKQNGISLIYNPSPRRIFFKKISVALSSVIYSPYTIRFHGD
jgi:hypothetical protein